MESKLQGLRSRFSGVLQRDEIYLANHSLGRPLDQTALDIREGLDLWFADMDASWEQWIGEMSRWRGNTAKLLGYSRPDCIVPKTSAGQGLRAVLNSMIGERPVRIVSTTGEFDSIDFVLKTYEEKGQAQVTWVPPSADAVPVFSSEEIIQAIEREKPHLVVISKAIFSTGQILRETHKIAEAAHDHGAKILLDVYHAAGVIPLDLEAEGIDFAIGGSYKYLRGGPGACWLAIHPRLLHDHEATPPTLDTGWFAKSDTFGYARTDRPLVKSGGDGWLESTPPILMPYQARAGLDLVLELGVEEIRRDSLKRQAKLRTALNDQGLEVFVPSTPENFGAFSLLPHSNATEACRALKVRGVNVDSRGKFIRLCPDFLTTDEEIEKAAVAVREVLAELNQ